MSSPPPDADSPTQPMPHVGARTATQIPYTPYTPPPVEEAIVVEPATQVRARNVTPAAVRRAEGNPLGYALARLVAAAIDLGLVAGVLTIFAYALIAINPLTGLPTNTQRGFDATLAMGVVLAIVIDIVCEALLGTTIGKLALGLHVRALRDRRVGFGRAFVRVLLRPLDLLVIGGVMAMLPAHRRLGDLAGGTIVTRNGPLRGYAPYVGWICIALVAALPFVVVGTARTVAGLVAFIEFGPGIGARAVLVVQHLLAHVPH